MFGIFAGFAFIGILTSDADIMQLGKGSYFFFLSIERETVNLDYGRNASVYVSVFHLKFSIHAYL